MLMLAAGGEACSDIEFLSSQPRLFGAVASDSTLYRTIRKITPTVLSDLNAQTAIVRAKMWRRMAATTGSAIVVLDIDASLVQIHSENKQGTGPTYKGGFGFHPILCFADATGENTRRDLAAGQRRSEHDRRSPRGSRRSDCATPGRDRPPVTNAATTLASSVV
jgi:hypothetical protein